MTSFVPSRKLSLFVVLSLADLALTFLLLERQGGGAYECNPVAAWWLARWGWMGLAGFKAAIVVLVILLTTRVARQRPRVADRILMFGCATLVAVLIHSGCLMPRVYSDADHAEAIQTQSRQLERQAQGAAAHTQLISDLGHDLAAKRRSLSEALEILSAAEEARNPEWLQKLSWRFPGFSTKEMLSIRLIEEAISWADAVNYGSVDTFRELNTQFRSRFGRSSPRPDTIPNEEANLQ